MVDNAFLNPEDIMKPWPFYLLDEQAFHSVNFILNPVSGDRVLLPSQSTIPCTCNNSPFFFTKVVASAVPMSQHCAVADLCSFGKYLVFCRPTDKSWTLIVVEDEGLLFHDIEIIDGKLYASTRNASEFLMVFDIQDACNGCNPPSPPKTETLVMLHPRPLPHNMVTSDGVIREEKCDHVYLLKDSTSKELFMIYCRVSAATELDPIIPWLVIVGPNAPTPIQIEGFRVFKLEHKNGPCWVSIFNLGDRIVFSSLNVLPLERNCICFAFESSCFVSPSNGYEAGVFSLTNSTIRRDILPQDHKRTRLNGRCIWLTPNIVC